MAKSDTAINPQDQFKILENPTVMPIIVDLRGPLVYDRDLEASLNGSDPEYMKKDGV